MILCGCQVKQSPQTSRQSNHSTGTATEKKKTADPPKPTVKNETPKCKWQYVKDVDDLSGYITSLRAQIVSENTFKYSVDGYTTKLGICIQYVVKLQSNSVIICFVEDENQLCKISDYQGQGFLVSFDDGPVDDTWTIVNYLSKDRFTLGITSPHSANNFIEKLKKSKTCRIQVNIDNQGSRTFFFKTEGLKWDFN